MSSLRHSQFARRVEGNIERRLEVFYDALPGRFTAQGDSNLKLKDESELQPDGSFWYCGDDGYGKRPSLVIEVANSQSSESLISKAID
jgi:hypothetical protein